MANNTNQLSPLMTVAQLLALWEKYDDAASTDLCIIGSASKIVFSDKEAYMVENKVEFPGEGLNRSFLIFKQTTTDKGRFSTLGELKSLLLQYQKDTRVVFQSSLSSEYYHMPKDLEQTLCISVTPGLFKGTLVCPMTAEKYLVDKFIKLQLDWPAAIRLATGLADHFCPENVRVWYVEGKWFTTSELSKAYPWLPQGDREKLCISKCNGILQCWNSLIPIDQAKDKFIGLQKTRSREPIPNPNPIELILAKCKEQQSLDCPTGTMVAQQKTKTATDVVGVVTDAEQIPPIQAVQGLQLVDCVAQLATLCEKGQGNMPTNVSKKFNYWNASFDEETYGIRQFDHKTDKKSFSWTSVALGHTKTLVDRISVRELYEKLLPLARQKPWAIVSVTYDNPGPYLAKLSEPVYSVKRTHQWVPISQSSDNPFCNGGSIWETYTQNSQGGTVDANHFADHFPQLYCWVVDKVFYSEQHLEQQFPGIDRFNSKLFVPVTPGSKTFVPTIPNLSAKILQEAYPHSPLTPVQELIQQFVAKTPRGV